MQIIKHDLGRDVDSVTILPISDIHLGSRLDMKALKSAINTIKTIPNVYTVLNGDLTNNAIKTSVSDIYSEEMPPERQLEVLYDLLEPIKHKILGVTPGNHDLRTYRLTGIDIIKNICYRLGIQNVYSNNNFVIFLSFGQPSKTRSTRRYTYSIYVTHGYRSGRTNGGKINSLTDLTKIVDADIFLHAHTHLPATFKQGVLTIQRRNKTLQERTQLFVNTSAWLKYGGYGLRNNYTPPAISDVQIFLEPTQEDPLRMSCIV